MLGEVIDLNGIIFGCWFYLYFFFDWVIFLGFDLYIDNIGMASFVLQGCCEGQIDYMEQVFNKRVVVNYIDVIFFGF